MKRGVSVLVIGVLLACCSASVFAMGAQQQKPAEPIKLVYWMFEDPVIESDKGLPKEQWYITGAIERFQKANPGIQVELLVLPMEGNSEKFKAAGIAQNGPDICNLWVGSMLVENKQFILPLDTWFTAAELKGAGGLIACRENYSATGPLLGMPRYNDSLVIFYNKAIFRKAGVTDAMLPKDLNGLYALCEKLKAAGETPMVFGDKQGYFSTFLMLPMYATATGTTGIRDIVEGRQTFSGDKDFVASAVAYQELYKRGYTNVDVASLDHKGSRTKFANGGAAMIANGQWLIPEAQALLKDDLGMMKVPSLRADVKYPGTVVGGPSQALLVTSYSKHPAEAVKFLKFLLTKAELESEITVKYHGTGSTPYGFVSPEVFKDPFSKQLQEFAMNSLLVPWIDNQFPPEVANEFYRLSPLLLSAKVSPEEFCRMLDEQLAKK